MDIFIIETFGIRIVTEIVISNTVEELCDSTENKANQSRKLLPNPV